MLFSTFTFGSFLALVVLLRWVLPHRATIPFLLAASYVFYLSWDPPYLLLLVGATTFTYGLGRALSRRGDHRPALVALGVVGCIALLAYFKYAVFLVAQLNHLRRGLGLHAWPIPDILLPLGISFFTFQMVSYVVDVYRGERAERSWLRYSLYIAFFPQLIAGPIVRASELLPQLSKPVRFDAKRFIRGLDLLALGFVKKLVFADNFAKWADHVFETPDAQPAFALWVGLLAYAGQIYCDFSAYTDIARGAARLLGYELPRNFSLPYLSRNVTEFWRRWHMTLSRWLRDYLYIPLGGNRHGRRRQVQSVLLTMGLGGLWHGASWNFVVWGLFHGVLLLVHKFVVAFWASPQGQRFDRLRRSAGYDALALVTTFLLVCLGWVLFRAPTMTTAGDVYRGLFAFDRPGLGASWPQDMRMSIILLFLLAVGHFVGRSERLERGYDAVSPPLRGAVWAGATLSCYLLATASTEFIYFQF